MQIKQHNLYIIVIVVVVHAPAVCDHSKELSCCDRECVHCTTVHSKPRVREREREASNMMYSYDFLITLFGGLVGECMPAYDTHCVHNKVSVFVWLWRNKKNVSIEMYIIH